MTIIAFSSDFHIDINKKKILESVKQYLRNHKVDIFCFAGDMSESVHTSINALIDIRDDLGIKVLGLPGNHEMRDKTFSSSFDALETFHNKSDGISVTTNPLEFSDWAIIGNMSWFDYSTSSKLFNDYQYNKMEYNDIRSKDLLCNWKDWHHIKVADHLLSELKKQLEIYKHKNIIMMTHIIPYLDYVEFKNDSSWDYWNAFMGNVCLGYYADKYNVKISQFGHTHKRINTYRNGVQIICYPLGYRHEWKQNDIELELFNAIRLINI